MEVPYGMFDIPKLKDVEPIWTSNRKHKQTD